MLPRRPAAAGHKAPRDRSRAAKKNILLASPRRRDVRAKTVPASTTSLPQIVSSAENTTCREDINVFKSSHPEHVTSGDDWFKTSSDAQRPLEPESVKCAARDVIATDVIARTSPARSKAGRRSGKDPFKMPTGSRRPVALDESESVVGSATADDVIATQERKAIHSPTSTASSLFPDRCSKARKKSGGRTSSNPKKKLAVRDGCKKAAPRVLATQSP